MPHGDNDLSSLTNLERQLFLGTNVNGIDGVDFAFVIREIENLVDHGLLEKRPLPPAPFTGECRPMYYLTKKGVAVQKAIWDARWR